MPARVRGASNEAVKATDRYVHDNPWRAIAYGRARRGHAILAAALLRSDE
jgi:ElaB/YqjD/DUF883 family membrane-anchored ribosome-binding protein